MWLVCHLKDSLRSFWKVMLVEEDLEEDLGREGGIVYKKMLMVLMMMN